MDTRSWSRVGLACIMLLALAAPISAAPQTYGRQESSPKASAKPDDATLDTRVEKRLKADAVLRRRDINVDVNNGVVTLRGTVTTTTERARAARLARVRGVTRVDNQLEVDVRARATTGADKGKMERVATEAREKASRAGEAITDAWITTKVKSQFIGEDALEGSDINVDTADKVVTLKGTVTSEAGRQRAIDIAKSTEGVKRVVDNLIVAPKK